MNVNFFIFFFQCLITVFLFAVPCIAQSTDEENLEQLNLKDLLEIKIDISSAKAKTIFNTPSTVSIITKDMIKNYNFKTVTEAIQTLAGFAVYPTYHKRDLPSGRGVLQNQYSNKVLLLINSIPTWHAITGEANFERIDINTVERIEILKGPGSVLYGSNAYSGAVNIVLKSSLENVSDMSIGAGDGQAFATSGNFGHSAKNIHLYSGGGMYNEKGIRYEWTDKAGEQGTLYPSFNTADLVFYLELFDNHSFLFNGSSSGQAFFGSDPLFSKGAGQRHETDGYLVNYTFRKAFNEKLTLKSGLTYDWNQVNFFLEPIHTDSFAGIDVNTGESLRMNWAGYRLNGFSMTDIQFSKALNLEIGIDIDYRQSSDSTKTKIYLEQKDKILQTSGLDKKSVYEISGFSQLGLDYKKIAFLLGARLTVNQFYGSNIAPRSTFTLALNETNSIKAIYGQSYRSPSFLEVHILSHDSTRRGNKDLKPEKSNSYEIAYLTSFHDFFIQILGYHATYEGTIIRVNVTDTIQQTGEIKKYQTFENGKTFNAQGVELELKYENPKVFTFFMNVTAINGNDGDRDESGHYNFKYIPEYSVSSGIMKNFHNFYASVLCNTWDETKGHRETIKPQFYFDANLGFSHSFSSFRVNHTVWVKNLLDDEIVFPEYADRKNSSLNSIPTEFGYGRRIGYTAKFSF